MAKKYEFVNSDTKMYGKYKLTRIRALRNISRHGVVAGDLGGYIESSSNLSAYDDCWVGGDAMVFSGGNVNNNALVTDKSIVSYGGVVRGNAKIFGSSTVTQGATAQDNAQMFDTARLSMDSSLRDDAIIGGNIHIMKSSIFKNAKLNGKIIVTEALIAFSEGSIEHSGNTALRLTECEMFRVPPVEKQFNSTYMWLFFVAMAVTTAILY